TVYATLAATFNGFPDTPSGPKVIAGASLNTSPVWTDVSGNLPAGVPTNSVITDGAGGLIVADDTGVFWASTLNGTGTAWSRIGTGLPNVQVMDVVLTSAGTLIAATHGRGAWNVPFSTNGLLRVTTSPASASQLLVDGHIDDSWGLTWVKLAPGSHTVHFSHVEG